MQLLQKGTSYTTDTEMHSFSLGTIFSPQLHESGSGRHGTRLSPYTGYKSVSNSKAAGAWRSII